MKEIIIQSTPYISLGRLVKTFKVIENFKNTIQRIAFDSTKALITGTHLCYIFPFFFEYAITSDLTAAKATLPSIEPSAQDR